MYQLSNDQVDIIDQDLISLGLTTPGVRANILDHLCILIEQQVRQPDEFYEIYQSILPQFYRAELRELERQTQLLLLSRAHLILTKIQFFGLLVFIVAAPFVIYLLCATLGPSAPNTNQLPKTLWGPVLAYASWPLCSLIVVFSIPDSLESPIPKGSRIALGCKPIVGIITQ